MTYPPGPGQDPQQPQYPQYPPLGDPGQYNGPGQPQYPPPKGKKLGLWIGLAAALVVVLAVGIGLAVAFWPGGSRPEAKPVLTGHPQSEYVALLPKKEDFGSHCTVGDDSAPNSADTDEAQKKFLSQLTATPSGCGLSDLAEKSKSVADKNQKLAAVKGTLHSGGTQGMGQKDPTQITVSISDGASYDTAVQALRDYITKCSSATMQGSITESGIAVSVTMKINITEVKPPSVESDKSFGVQMKSTMSINAGGQDTQMQLSQQVYASLLRGFVVSSNTNDLGEIPLADKLFAATVDRANKA